VHELSLLQITTVQLPDINRIIKKRTARDSLYPARIYGVIKITWTTFKPIYAGTLGE
jgi:hypothetical protein